MAALISRSSKALYSILLLAATANAQTSSPPTPSFHFASGDSAANIPIEVVANGLVFVNAKVNGHEGSFILDNASQGFTIDPEFAGQISLDVSGSATARGDGAGTIQAGVIRDVTIGLSGLDLTHRVLITIGLKSLEPALGHTVDGIIGSRLFDDFIVAIDYAHRFLSVYLPGRYQPPTPAVSLPVRIDSHGFQFIDATFSLSSAELFAASFLIDSGAGTYAEIYKPFSDQHHLPPASMKLLDQPSAGVDGTIQSRDGRAESIRIGPYSLRNVPITFPQVEEGLMAAKDHAGLIGAEFLDCFTAVFDNRGKRIWLAPNDNLGRPAEYDQSGLRIRAEGPGFHRFVVGRIVRPSPASEAGIEPGDVLLSIDRVLAENLTLTAMRSLLCQPKSTYSIEVSRGDRHLTFSLRPRPLI